MRQQLACILRRWSVVVACAAGFVPLIDSALRAQASPSSGQPSSSSTQSSPSPAQPSVGTGAPLTIQGQSAGVVIGSAQLQPARDPQLPKGTARVRGMVRVAETGAPARRATVQATSTSVGGRRVAMTDANGAFELVDLPAGRFTIRASKSGWLTMSYGEPRPLAGGRTVAVAEGAIVERIDIALHRGGVVTGRVVDEFGDPVTGVMVLLQRRIPGPDGQLRMMGAGPGEPTNDAGEFRLHGLVPGSYYLSAATANRFDPEASAAREGFALTYYPGVPGVAGAQPIRVRAGETVSDLTIPLMPVPLVRVSGTVLDAGGQPVTRGVVLMFPRDGLTTAVGMRPNPIGPDGTFSVAGVAPGPYILRAAEPGAMPGSNTPSLAEVTVAGEDIVGIRLTPPTPARVAGTVVFTGTAPTPPRAGTVQIQLQPILPSMMPGPASSPATLRADGTFELTALSGRFMVRARVEGSGAEGAWTLKAVHHRGVDVTDSGIELTAGADVRDVEIELTNLRTQLSGSVTDARGNRAEDYTVLVFARDQERRFSPRHRALLRPQEEGRFRTSSLPPGDYEAVALDAMDPGRNNDPEFLDALSGTGTTFSLGEGESKMLELRLSDIVVP